MFQISDDILDIESDKVKNNPNICFILDKDIVSKLLKYGCKWLYENAKIIHELMKQLLEKQLLEKQDLKNPARKHSANGLENYETNSDEEYIIYDSDNYSSEGDNGGGSCSGSDSEEDDSEEVISDIKNVTFNLNVINEIIEKIENRIK